MEPGTIRTRFTNVRGVIRAALQDRLLPHDVTAAIKLPRQRKASAAQAIPSPEEVGELISACDAHFVAFVSLCAFAGLRLGEAAALRASDIDFLKREIRVSRQVQRANGKQVELRPPKYGSERVVYAADELIATISEHIRVQATDGEPDWWLFLAKVSIRCTRTQSATCGAKQERLRALSTACMICGTSTPLD